MFEKMAEKNRSPLVAGIVRLGFAANGFIQKMRFLTLLNKFKKTWFGELLGIYRWKETWIAISLPILLLVLPASWLCLLMVIPNPWNAILFWISFIGFVIGSAWGNPFGRR